MVTFNEEPRRSLLQVCSSTYRGTSMNSTSLRLRPLSSFLGMAIQTEEEICI